MRTPAEMAGKHLLAGIATAAAGSGGKTRTAAATEWPNRAPA